MVNTAFAPQKFMWWWDSIIDLMISEPELTKADIAKRLGCSTQYIYMITGSDLFAARLSQRRTAFNQEINNRITGRLASAADRALDLLSKQLELKQTAVPIPTLVDIAEKTLGRLGYGVRDAPVNVNVGVAGEKGTRVTVSIEDLNAARAALARSEQAKLIEHEVPALGGLDRPAAPSSGVDGAAEGPELDAVTSDEVQQ